MHGLTDQVELGGLSLRNRLVMPPLTTGFGSGEGKATRDLLRFYRRRAKETGMVIVEAAAVSPEGRIVPNSIGLWEDGQIPGMAELAQAIKSEGAAAVIQLNHAGAKAWPFEPRQSCLAPSDIACRPGVVPMPADAGALPALVEAFATAAVRAETAGFEGVEIHGAHLYLLSQFLSPLTNRRTDAYGGSTEGRAALPLEVVRGVKAALKDETAVLFRLNILENLEGGQTPEDALAAGKLLAGAGVDVLDLSLAVQGGWNEEEGIAVLMTTSAYTKDQSPGQVVELAGRFRSACGVPVIAVGRLNSRAAADEALAAGADLVAVGRQMICDPDTPGKILAGKDGEIHACEACMACFASLGKGRPVSCKENRHLPD